MTRYVYFFGAGISTSNHSKKEFEYFKELLGGKGANLAEMGRLGIPVPPGFTISTKACLHFMENNQELDTLIKSEISMNLEQLEKVTAQKFGDPNNPLLVSVRSGARVSMPGMMDTLLNLGLNDESVVGLANKTGNERFAYDCYRRLIQMYGNVVLGLGSHHFDSTLDQLRESLNVVNDYEIPVEALKHLVIAYKQIILEETGKSFPQDVYEQLWTSIFAVFSSWGNKRAIKYREIHDIPHHWGTAVNIQSMVFGNKGPKSGTGVCFSRNPSTGAKGLFGEYLLEAQGEDVVAGIRTPMPMNEYSLSPTNLNNRNQCLDKTMPEVYEQLSNIVEKLESHYCDMQDIEFTIEEKKLYILQTRNGKRSAQASLKIAIDLVKENILNIPQALMKVSAKDLDQLLHPSLDPRGLAKAQILASGLPASPGAASGVICFHPGRVIEWKNLGYKVILVREETSPEDIVGMDESIGILTIRGGMTSHAAVVARGMGKVCVVGVNNIKIDEKQKQMLIGATIFSEGDFITLDGSAGKVYSGIIPTVEVELGQEFKTLMTWADEYRDLKVRANADNGLDAAKARKLGAKGIGLCRTEHMFFHPERILAVREMILASDRNARMKALEKIYPFQKKDFIEIFQEMDGLPVNIRLLDPPLHEFMPHEENEKKLLAESLNIPVYQIDYRIKQLHEINPMLGHRGCRLGITFPEIYEIQVKAIIEAGIFVTQKSATNPIKVLPEIMIPLVASSSEFFQFKNWIKQWADEIFSKYKTKIDYKIGTMVEVPRLALTISEIAAECDFLSFGTNDLTQLTYGISRDDASKFLPQYVGQGYWPKDPFITIDEKGVGLLVKNTTDVARLESSKVSSKIHIGICGEHGGDPDSIDFFHRSGLDYVSCSPFRVPLARLSAAQSSIRSKESQKSQEI